MPTFCGGELAPEEVEFVSKDNEEDLRILGRASCACGRAFAHPEPQTLSPILKSTALGGHNGLVAMRF